MSMDAELRQFLRTRAGDRCEYCQMPQALDDLAFQVDHVIAQQHHGATAEENLAWACYACNRHKGPNIAGFDGETGQTIRLFHPRNDVWKEHFRWEDSELIGITSIGRVTVDVLAINLDYRVALRRVLTLLGDFPVS